MPDGTVIYPSFYRPWLASYIVPGSLAAKYQSLRPDWAWNYVPLLNPATGQPVIPSTPDPAKNIKVQLTNGTVFYTSFIPPDMEGLPPIPPVGGTIVLTPSQLLAPDVKNLEFGPGSQIPNVGNFNNDSNWMDFGWPVMTAPNGKRFKAMGAILTMDLNNRVNLGVSGNRLGNVPAAPALTYPAGAYPNRSHTSTHGMGPSEINPNRLLAVRVLQATEANLKVTITTQTPHGLAVGDFVVVSGVGQGMPVPPAVKVWPKTGPYNGYFQVTGATATAFTYNVLYKGLTSPATGGAVFAKKKLDEMQLVLDRRYGGTFYGTPAQWRAAPQNSMPNWSYGGAVTPTQYTSSMPIGKSLNFPVSLTQPQLSQSNPIDADGLNASTNTNNQPTGVSSSQPYSAFTMTSVNAIGASPAVQRMYVNTNGFPFTLTPGMAISVGDGFATETGATPVIVQTVDATTRDPANPTKPFPSFTAVFKKTHPAGAPITTVGATMSTAALNPKAVGNGLAQQMFVGHTQAALPGKATNFWSLQPGMLVNIGVQNVVPPVPVETVVVGSVNANSITARFTQVHPANTLVWFTPYSAVPNYPGTEGPPVTGANTGYGNGLALETQFAPLAYNPFNPNVLPFKPLVPAHRQRQRLSDRVRHGIVAALRGHQRPGDAGGFVPLDAQHDDRSDAAQQGVDGRHSPRPHRFRADVQFQSHDAQSVDHSAAAGEQGERLGRLLPVRKPPASRQSPTRLHPGRIDGHPPS